MLHILNNGKKMVAEQELDDGHLNTKDAVEPIILSNS